ncbi:lamin tail domain-containing protein [Haloarchaeobius sp. TZWWS8]|uniref:lamin tail domain-containing protein n=1 Tax=Haloarchaeobius sp. TZWWS8 TaxID=3446121 RepID=UPI003EBF4CB0
MSSHEKLHHSPLVVDEIQNNPMGRDVKRLDDEFVSFENSGLEVMDIAGWTVENEAGDVYTFPDRTILEPGARITLHSGPGIDTDTDYYWGSREPIWGNLGDTVLVHDQKGVLRIRETYNE